MPIIIVNLLNANVDALVKGIPVASVLHDVDLAAVGPRAVLFKLRHDPESCASNVRI
jgi:hypothetical protein